MNAQRCFTAISLPPADRKHIKTHLASASKRSMYAGTLYMCQDISEGVNECLDKSDEAKECRHA